MLEGGERVSDAGKGEFVGLYVEVADCVVDKLWEGWFCSASNFGLTLDGSVNGLVQEEHTVAGSSSRSIFAVWTVFVIQSMLSFEKQT